MFLSLEESRDIYGQDLDESDDCADNGVLNESREDVDDDGGGEGKDEENNGIMGINNGTEPEEYTRIEGSVKSAPGSDEEAVVMLQRSIRRLLNCVSESQMAKTISGLVDLFSDRPCATVRLVLIEEIDILLGVRYGLSFHARFLGFERRTFLFEMPVLLFFPVW